MSSSRSRICLGLSPLLFILLVCAVSEAKTAESDALRVGLHNLIVSVTKGEQADAHSEWQAVVDSAKVSDLLVILGAMGSPNELVEPFEGPESLGPLAENWIRAAVDTIAEREIENNGNLPTKDLENFVRDASHSPRARRIAYEWLVKVDHSAPERLLPTMLDDPSLELRYDAIASLIDDAKAVADNSSKIEKYQRALKSARDKMQLKECAEALKELGESLNMAQQLGFLVNWSVIGPFDNADRAGFDKVFPPEQSVNLDAQVQARDGKVKWKKAVAEQESLENLGVVDLNEALVEEKSVLAYAVTTFVSKKDQQVECRWESKEATKLWVNGEEVAVKNVYHSGSGFDQYIVPCQLKAGPNEILLKVCQNEQTEPWTRPWDFRLRVTDELGGAIEQAE